MAKKQSDQSHISLPQTAHGCPMEGLLTLLSGPWTTYLLWTLHTHGALRFGVLKRTIGNISAKVLTERLRVLEAAGIIFRDVNPTTPPEVSYGLTSHGLELMELFDSLNALAQKWAKKPI